MSLTHNLKSFKNLSIGTSPMKFTSLSDLITNHVKTTSNTRESKVNSNTMPFNSLADLTAHHLQNTSSIMNSTNSDRPHSSSTNFVIPKLSIKKDRSNNLNDMTLDTSILQNNRNVKSDLVDDKEKDYSIDSLEKSILNMLALSDDCTNIKRNSYNLQAKEDSLLNVNGTRTPSPDNWMIDLSSALKETTLVASDSSSQTKSNVLKTSKNNISNPNLHITNRDNEVPYICLPTTLNLSSLKNVKLPYTKKNVSLFGRTLCRTWKSRKPALKSQRQQHETVKRFDFSVPYSRNNRT
ncbi:uncharacterized protein LOC143188219 [Calliopsis andreniformis]|uniref:uncharacterized protein LOC143188219 n=1 Tax=Calliopsis andreniformis TaxID=337506 RepID=UPI003FCDD76C